MKICLSKFDVYFDNNEQEPNTDLNGIQISTIIPTLNEASHIEALIRRLRDGAGTMGIEIIVADAGSTDATAALSEKCGAKVLHCGVASRPAQMNLAAKVATGEILYFVHADALPPKDYAAQILRAVMQGAKLGSFRFRFDSDKASLRFNAWCTRIPVMMCRGGDQTLFITRTLFEQLNGFDESHVVMEDYDIIRRGRHFGKFKILSDDVLVSARKYKDNTYVRVNLANFVVFALYYFGVKPEKLKRMYQHMIHHEKFKDAGLCAENESGNAKHHEHIEPVEDNPVRTANR
jgi:rSAM/selenodomain-associated transferase 2